MQSLDASRVWPKVVWSLARCLVIHRAWHQGARCRAAGGSGRCGYWKAVDKPDAGARHRPQAASPRQDREMHPDAASFRSALSRTHWRLWIRWESRTGGYMNHLPARPVCGYLPQYRAGFRRSSCTRMGIGLPQAEQIRCQAIAPPVCGRSYPQMAVDDMHPCRQRAGCDGKPCPTCGYSAILWISRRHQFCRRCPSGHAGLRSPSVARQMPGCRLYNRHLRR